MKFYVAALFALLVLHNVVFVAGSTNTTSSATCPNKCSMRGKCDPRTNTCICPNGFYGDDCSKSINMVMPGPWGAFRGLVIIFYFFIIAVGVLALVWKRSDLNKLGKENLGLFNSKTIVLIEIVILALDIWLFFAIDPHGYLKILPFPLVRAMFALVFPMLVTINSTILIHWSNVYHNAVDALKYADRISRINKNYVANVNFEDIITQRVKLFQKMRLPFLILILIAFIFQLIRECLLWYKIITMRHAFQQIWLAYFFIIFFIQTVGFFYYGTKLISIMPDVIKRKMTRITRIVQIQSLLFLIAWSFVICIMAIPAVRPAWFYAAEFVFRASIAIILFVILSIFTKFSKTFPFIFPRKSEGGSSKTSGSQSEPSHASADIELQGSSN